jgi:DNA-binding response OmpR family regulator
LKSDNNILVVDDEPSITDGLRLLLGAEGYKVETAPSFGAARATLERTKPKFF